MKVKSLSKCPTLRDRMDCSLPGSSVHGIFQAKVLEWVAIALSSSLYYNRTEKVNTQQYNNSRDFSVPFSTMDESFGWKISKKTLNLNYILNQMNPTGIHIFHSTKVECTFFSHAQETVSGIDHMMSH